MRGQAGALPDATVRRPSVAARPLSFNLAYALFISLFVLIYCFNAHSVWIVYDMLLISLATYYWMKSEVVFRSYQWFMMGATLFYFTAISVCSGHFFVGMLSTWDTFKHVILFLLLARMTRVTNTGIQGQKLYLNRLYGFVFLTVMIQAAFVYHQVSTGVFFDNVAGTMGDGGTHPMAYLALLFLILAVVLRKGLWVVALAFLVGAWLNMKGENVGYFVLLPLLFGGIVANTGIRWRYLAVCLVLGLAVFSMLGKPVFGKMPYRDVILSRVHSFVSGEGARSFKGPSRGSALATAVDVGGWFGRGPGSFSNIYHLRGYDYSPKADPTQIDIAESSHLIYESGLMGFILAWLTYSSLLWSVFDRLRNKLFSILFFTACMFYGSLLMTEPQIFLFMMIMFLLKQYEVDILRVSSSDRRAYQPG